MWDTHSPRVPSIDEVDDLLTRAIAVLGADRLWASPDCGLKTPGWPEVEAALANLVAAALRSRRRLAPLPADEPPPRLEGVRSRGPGWSEGRRSDRHPPSRAGFSGEPADYSAVVVSMAVWPRSEPMVILRGWACSVTGSVTVRTP